MMSWENLTTIQIPNTTEWQYSSPIPQIQFVRVTHQLSHPEYLKWYGLIAQSLDGSPPFLMDVRKLWATHEGSIFNFLPFTEPDFFGGIRRIAVRGSTRQPYNLTWAVELQFWNVIELPVTQTDIDQINDVLDLIQYDLDLTFPTGEFDLTSPLAIPLL
jgi:hypothetical protein